MASLAPRRDAVEIQPGPAAAILDAELAGRDAIHRTAEHTHAVQSHGGHGLVFGAPLGKDVADTLTHVSDLVEKQTHALIADRCGNLAGVAAGAPSISAWV